MQIVAMIISQEDLNMVERNETCMNYTMRVLLVLKSSMVQLYSLWLSCAGEEGEQQFQLEPQLSP